MSYVDGFLAAVLNDKKPAFIDHARVAAAVFKRHCALKTVENWGDDVPKGEVTSFPMAVKCGPNETVVFSWVIWPSKDARDVGWQNIMEDPDMSPKKIQCLLTENVWFLAALRQFSKPKLATAPKPL